MTDRSKDAWNEVDKQFSELGHMLAERYRKAGEERGATADEDRRKLEEALRAVTRQLDQAFTSVGETVRDPEAKDTLKQAGSALGEALSATFSEVGDEIRKRLGSSKGEKDTPSES
jgi:hypothetical protein